MLDPTPIGKMHAAFAMLGPYEVHAVDTTASDVEASAAAVVAGLEAGRFRLP